MHAIEVQDLTKRYGARTAVDRISFTVDPGEVVGFLGPNGAGKSTTLRILTCFQPATSGTAHVAGYDVFKQSVKVRENVGYLPESTPLYGEMRVRSYLRYRAKLKGVARKDRERFIDEAMERCDVKDVEDRIIGHLSKGYRQRVGLADALVHRPPVLILDEPTSGLDPNQVRDVRDLVKEIAADTTVMFSTHTIPWVEQVCNRVIVINRGRIITDGTLDALRAEVAPWSRIEFRTEIPAADALGRVRAVPGVSFAEDLTVGDLASVRCLTRTDAATEVQTALEAAFDASLQDVVRSDATLEDLFAMKTRGSQEVLR